MKSNIFCCFISGCPELLRTDPGTENSTIATLQMVFRRNGSDSRAGIESHRYGKSTSNQAGILQMISIYSMLILATNNLYDWHCKNTVI